jgi:hypothetical protein
MDDLKEMGFSGGASEECASLAKIILFEKVEVVKDGMDCCQY